MPRLARHAVVLTLWAAPAALIGAPTSAEPPVRVHVDVHVPLPGVEAPVPVVAVPPPPPEPEHESHHHHHHEERRPDRERWSDRDDYRDRRASDFHVPPDRVPRRGLCRVWFDDLPPDRQPPAMSCDRAHHAARRHGGRVIWADSSRAHQDGGVASTTYGRADFQGVPPDRLPPPGSCRVWIDGIPPDRQPPPSTCEHAEREAHRVGGRLLYMPGP